MLSSVFWQGAPDLFVWVKSSHSASGNDSCVEVRLSSGFVSIRDSKNADGPLFDVSSRAWKAFLGSVPHGPDPAQ
ncbi:DUF397 domain-containing protein [Lentzea sp. BCCO 10_0061]|uniref:DUF397 domain-containing protein n=1 Tax=Lentzea sokolovensis TaxID=3095429 RepID=A0ABU4UXQ0_9PSEU|nr:DUF397 domain-containing protein [Lentzea sp. BCCO 10_0061]MDX8144239.1 DUF397 domain-containing protein [Lentzea sp. BCCO 10_0061]